MLLGPSGTGLAMEAGQADSLDPLNARLTVVIRDYREHLGYIEPEKMGLHVTIAF